jgi:hypothetical protein
MSSLLNETMVLVFSNRSLRWPEVQVIKRVAAHYPGYVMNLYLYQIKSHNKNLLHTYSPLNVLEQRRIYYMYPTFGFPKRQTYDIVPYTVSHQQESATIYLPSSAKEGDVIAVEDIHGPKQQEIFLPGIFF